MQNKSTDVILFEMNYVNKYHWISCGKLANQSVFSTRRYLFFAVFWYRFQEKNG